MKKDRYPSGMAIHLKNFIKRLSSRLTNHKGKAGRFLIAPFITITLSTGPGCSPQTDIPVPDSPVPQQNQPPVITTDPVTTALPDSAYLYQTAAVDPDSNDLAWSLLKAPEGILMDTHSGLLFGEITTPGIHAIRIAVMDEAGSSAEQSFTVTLVHKPVITSIPPRYAFSGATLRYQLHAHDPEDLALTYLMTSGPTGMELDSNSGLLSWVDPQTGIFDVALTVTNSLGLNTSQHFPLEVLHEQGMAIVSHPGNRAYVSELYEYQIATLALQDSDLSYSLIQGPPGMILDDMAGNISWEPQAEGLYHVEVLVVNEAGHQDTQEYDIEVISLESMDLMFNTQINTLFGSISLGHFQEAAQLLTPQAVTGLLPVLRDLQPFLMSIQDSFGPAQRIKIKGDIAEYMISGGQAGPHRSYFVTFIKSASGEWKIHSM